MFSRSEYSYILPQDLIAETPANPHHNARMMVISREKGDIIAESTFWHLPEFLGKDRVLFFNDSKVQKARIRIREIENPHGEKILLENGEICILDDLGDNRFEALIYPGKKFKIGTTLLIDTGVKIIIEGLTPVGRIGRVYGISVYRLMEKYGELPLPPYIEYSKEKEKEYQTSFAKKEGSKAAPTASLHFTKELMEKIENEKYFLTLHIGLGTFKGIDTSDIRDYKIHKEKAEVPITIFRDIYKIKEEEKTILAVGTTACRTLESLPYLWKCLSQDMRNSYSSSLQSFWDKKSSYNREDSVVENIIFDTDNGTIRFSTEIYIYPGIPLQIIDELITNFHLPESSLLVLVSAILGRDTTMSIYTQAIEKKYRFYSFGDGMYIKR